MPGPVDSFRVRDEDSVQARSKQARQLEDDDEPNDVSWKDFDAEAYLSKQRLKPGQDAYARNKFNQQSSDDTKPDRAVPDTRNHM